MEANKSCHLPSAGWRTRKAGSTIPSKESKALEAGAGGVSLGLRLKGQEPGAQRRQEKMGVPAQAESASPSLPFCSVWAPVDWMTVMILGGRVTYSVYHQSLISSRNIPGTVFHQDTLGILSPHWHMVSHHRNYKWCQVNQRHTNKYCMTTIQLKK